jgi:hypothetical protein
MKATAITKVDQDRRQLLDDGGHGLNAAMV